MKKTCNIIVFAIFFCCNCNCALSQIKLQYDTTYFEKPELNVIQKSFLRSLNRIINKTSFCEDKKDGKTYINVITVSQDMDSNYVFRLLRSEVVRSAFMRSKGFFVINGHFFFVMGKDSLSDYPKGLFSQTGKVQTFYDLRLDMSFFDGEIWMDLLYKRKRLFLLKKYWF